MTTKIALISRTKIDWDLLRRNVRNATGLDPSSLVNQSPVKFTEAAELLIFIGYMYLDVIDITPHNMLLSLPRECMHFLHYTFLISCSRDTVDDLRERTRIHFTATDMGEGYCVLGTGSLDVWFDAIVLNLTHPNTAWRHFLETRLLLDKLMLFFEKEGLHAIFSKYNKKTQGDQTFLLEHQ